MITAASLAPLPVAAVRRRRERPSCWQHGTCVLEDTTFYVRRETFRLEFFAYQTQGGAVGDPTALARVSLGGLS